MFFFTYEKITGSSQKAEYKIREQHVTLTGNPIVSRDQDRMSGKIIQINLKTKKIKSFGEAKIVISPSSIGSK